MKKIPILITALLLSALILGSPGVAASTLQLLCRVDIGDPASEAGHNLVGWGPVEPYEHEYPSQPTSPWDGLENGRVVWGWIERYNEGAECATLTLNRCISDGAARMIRIAWLDGITYKVGSDEFISDDSFTVEVKNYSAPVGEYQQVFAWTGQKTKTLQTADIDITGLGLNLDGWIDVRLCATAPRWEHFASDMGQVAFDWIELWGEVPDGGGEGHTPGWWKNPRRCWPAPYDRDMLFNDVFGVDYPGMTLLDAVKQGGGGCKALGRHATAALLNAAHDDINYLYTDAQIKAMVQAAWGDPDACNDAKDLLEEQNELGADM